LNDESSTCSPFWFRRDAEQRSPPFRIVAGDEEGRHPQRRLGHHVGDPTRLGVVVQGVAHTLEQPAPQRQQILGRIGIEEAPDRERDAEVVHDRRPPVQRGPLEGDAEASLNRILFELARLQLELGCQPPGDDERVALVGALRAEPRAVRLRAVDHARAVGLPGRGHDVGRRVVARLAQSGRG